MDGLVGRASSVVLAVLALAFMLVGCGGRSACAKGTWGHLTLGCRPPSPSS
jgi:ABC-type uncharacterized transport system auxiliary subunit